MVSQESTCLSTGNSWDKKWSRKMKQSKKLWSRLTLEPKHSSILFNQCNFLSLNKIIVLHMYYLYYAQCEDRNCTTVNDSASVGIPHSISWKTLPKTKNPMFDGVLLKGEIVQHVQIWGWITELWTRILSSSVPSVVGF